MIFSAYNRQKSTFFSAYNRQNALMPFLQYTKPLLGKWFLGSSMFVSTCNGVRGGVFIPSLYPLFLTDKTQLCGSSLIIK